jgi:hypothetical protein
MKYYKAILIVCTALFIFSCKKNDDTSSTPTNTQLLTSGSWRITSSSFRVGTNDTPLPITSCLTDNLVTFHSDFTGSMTEGTDVCQGSQPTTNFTWSFANNESALNITGLSINGVSGPFKVVQLTDAALSLGKDTSQLNVSGTIIVNFQH